MTKDKYQLEVEKNYDWFKENKRKIVEENPNKINYYALIKNQKLISLYRAYDEAIIEANKKYKNEPFSIQILETKEFVHSLGSIGLQWKI
ncbi:hypothetical protein [Spiroplasma attinicola]|uniref:hypothetical protein n=1 Tax=Spiroplasma attinicola TaxID=2904537 RepID=UPI002022AD81|nr:hypothetical protein [Spiroplasma sp. JKS002670]MCL8209825.1 hypothetical protein [Spiroplasma sp. JKS002670]